jgi:hypothetical protein
MEEQAALVEGVEPLKPLMEIQEQVVLEVVVVEVIKAGVLVDLEGVVVLLA